MPRCDALQLAGRRFVEAEPEKFALGAFAGDRLFGAEVADELSLVVEAGGHHRHRRTSCWFSTTIVLGAGAARPVRASCDRPGRPLVPRSRRSCAALCCWARASDPRRPRPPPTQPPPPLTSI